MIPITRRDNGGRRAGKVGSMGAVDESGEGGADGAGLDGEDAAAADLEAGAGGRGGPGDADHAVSQLLIPPPPPPLEPFGSSSSVGAGTDKAGLSAEKANRAGTGSGGVRGSERDGDEEDILAPIVSYHNLVMVQRAIFLLCQGCVIRPCHRCQLCYCCYHCLYQFRWHIILQLHTPSYRNVPPKL